MNDTCYDRPAVTPPTRLAERRDCRRQRVTGLAVLVDGDGAVRHAGLCDAGCFGLGLSLPERQLLARWLHVWLPGAAPPGRLQRLRAVTVFQHDRRAGLLLDPFDPLTLQYTLTLRGLPLPDRL